jgi:hypothetical protein
MKPLANVGNVTPTAASIQGSWLGHRRNRALLPGMNSASGPQTSLLGQARVSVGVETNWHLATPFLGPRAGERCDGQQASTWARDPGVDASTGMPVVKPVDIIRLIPRVMCSATARKTRRPEMAIRIHRPDGRSCVVIRADRVRHFLPPCAGEPLARVIARQAAHLRTVVLPMRSRVTVSTATRRFDGPQRSRPGSPFIPRMSEMAPP